MCSMPLITSSILMPEDEYKTVGFFGAWDLLTSFYVSVTVF